MKVKLLSADVYSFLGAVELPQEVQAEDIGFGFKIKGYELIRIGGDPEVYEWNFDYFFTYQSVQVSAL